MRTLGACCMGGVMVAMGSSSVLAGNLLVNGNLDQVIPVEIIPGFALPKPAGWVNEGFLALTGPYENELSSEPWAGPAPTPVTMDGVLNDPPFNLSPDWGVFFKAFTGNVSPNGPATGHLYQDVPGTPGISYTLSVWAGGEANVLMSAAMLALEFRDVSGAVIQATEVNLFPTLLVPNGHPFSYKNYAVTAVAPAGTTTVRSRVSMIDGLVNPNGGGQAFVIDDFTLVAAPGCPADLDGNGIVDGADLGILLANWNSAGAGDLDGSGSVDGADLGTLLAAWGKC